MEETNSKDFEGSTQLIALEEAKDVVSFRKCQLKVVEGPDKDKKLDLERKPIRIGKKEDNDLALADNTVSRHHLVIEQRGDSFVLKDLDSTNGTSINGLRVKEAYLSPGDVISLGVTKIEFTAFDERSSSSPPPHLAQGDGREIRKCAKSSAFWKIAPTLHHRDHRRRNRHRKRTRRAGHPSAFSSQRKALRRV
jgi:predicted component of type VI protein secretion system